MSGKITARVDAQILKLLFNECDIWKRIQNGTLTTVQLTPSPSVTFRGGTSRILLHFNEKRKHTASTHRIMNEQTGFVFHWDEKGLARDRNWKQKNVIYRWVKESTGEIAHLGETERELRSRVANYETASKSSGTTNKKLHNEAENLRKSGIDNLYLEFTETVPGYDLSQETERKYAEALLIGYYRPYLMKVKYQSRNLSP